MEDSQKLRENLPDSGGQARQEDSEHNQSDHSSRYHFEATSTPIGGLNVDLYSYVRQSAGVILLRKDIHRKYYGS